MGRRWLGVSHRAYVRMPHAESWPDSLWWYIRRPGESTADRQNIINTYLERYARGAKVPDGFRDELVACLHDLSRIHTLTKWGKPRTKRYWTIPNYARANGIHPYTLMKRLRGLESIAKQMFPERAAAHGRFRQPLTQTEIDAIRLKYLEGVDVEAIAKQFKITKAHVGLLCKTEKQLKRAFAPDTEVESPTGSFDSEEPF
jgi:predicted DNA-binding protein (UPF0251 family)